MESYYGYEIARSGYAGALLGDKNHWVRSLPGRLLHNIISHGIARIAEFMTTDSPTVIAYGFTSPLLRSMGETEIIDELRVIIAEEERITAYFTFSSQMKPSLHQLRAYGSKNALVLDQDQETVIKISGKKLKSYAETFLPPMTLAKQYVKATFTNLGLFAWNEFHMKDGMKQLIAEFYQAIERRPDPIPYHEIVRTARIMDSIFTQIESRRLENLNRPLYECALGQEMFKQVNHERQTNDSIEISVKGKWMTVPALRVDDNFLIVKGSWVKTAVVEAEEWLESEIADPNPTFASSRRNTGEA